MAYIQKKPLPLGSAPAPPLLSPTHYVENTVLLYTTSSNINTVFNETVVDHHSQGRFCFRSVGKKEKRGRKRRGKGKEKKKGDGGRGKEEEEREGKVKTERTGGRFWAPMYDMPTLLFLYAVAIS